MPEPIPVIFHLWPWSVATAIGNESQYAKNGEIKFPFYGSPVVSVIKNAQILLDARHEKFIPLGPSFSNGTKIYEMPHGILSKCDAEKKQGNIILLSNGKSQNLKIQAQGAKSRTINDGTKDSFLSRIVLSWSQFFDDLMGNHFKNNRSNKQIETDNIPWDSVLTLLEQQMNEIQQPRLSLIVRIAEELYTNLSRTISGMRRILLRNYNMQQINRICEIDIRCLQWYVRQPGKTMAEKGGNRQELLAVVRQESFDVLENRVLKDFIYRCSVESLRYIDSEVEINHQFQNSIRAQSVRRFRELCKYSLKHPDFNDVPQAKLGVRPNYVLQNDLRYRNIWTWYCRLLRREEEEDQFWDWQTRTWTDIVRLLINLAIIYLTRVEPPHNGIYIKQLLQSSLQVTRNQVLGSRTRCGSEPGPFVIEQIVNGVSHSVAILEIVHPDDAHEHTLTQNLGRTGGHLYLVVRPLDNLLNNNHVFIIWGVNTAGTDKAPSWKEISESANNGLQSHRNILVGDRIPNLPKLQGLVIANSLQIEAADVVNEFSDAPVVIMSSDPNRWHEDVDFFAILLEEILEKIL